MSSRSSTKVAGTGRFHDQRFRRYTLLSRTLISASTTTLQIGQMLFVYSRNTSSRSTCFGVVRELGMALLSSADGFRRRAAFIPPGYHPASPAGPHDIGDRGGERQAEHRRPQLGAAAELVGEPGLEPLDRPEARTPGGERI